MEKLILDEKNLIGIGCHKKCYHHPSNAQQCVEVIYNQEGLKDIQREMRYRSYMAAHPNFDYSMLPHYFGEIATNLGKGYVYELIAQPDGTPCPTFRDYFQNLQLLKNEEELLVKLMRQLKEDMLHNEIITMNITEENIAVQTTPEGKKIRLLSDLGSSFFLPTDYWFRSVRLKRVQRHWEKMCDKFIELFPTKEVKEFTEKIR